MARAELTADQRRGAKASIVVVMLVLVLFVLELAAGRPIMDFRDEPLSVAYAVGVYAPVIALCILAYRRLERA